MKSENDQKRTVLNEEERKWLIAYFNVLIEMDFEIRKVSNEENKNV